MATYEEEELVLMAIFKNSLHEPWKDNQEFTHYVAELMGCGLDTLVHEPDRLVEERALVKLQTEDLAFNNYKTFIKTAECSREIFQDFQIIESHVTDVISRLPKFAAACSGFVTVAQDISHSRKMNTMTLQRHTQLLEVLEIPQLMDTCVRNAYYEEALELAAYTRRFEKKHSVIPVVKSICEEVKTCTQLMLSQLLQQLRCDIQLPACLRVIGYLRRMDVFSEAELRIKFLQARDSWFQSILDSIPSVDGYAHITKVIEASRVHLFDIVTQYRAIFSDDDPLAATVTQGEGLSESAIFPCWILRKVSAFLHTLQGDLERSGVEGRLDSVAGQCMYFGLSFSRVGCDFRGLIVPVLCKAATNIFRRGVKDAASRFEEAMQSYVLLCASSSSQHTTSSFYPSSSGGVEVSQLSPPSSLLEFAPLAVYCNDVVNALNDLRLCAPISVATDVVQILEESTKRVTDVLLKFHRAEQATFHGKEGSKFVELCTRYAVELLPFINACLDVLFPAPSLSSALGVSLAEFVMLKCGSAIDVDLVVEPIKPFLPNLQETLSSTRATASHTLPNVASATGSQEVTDFPVVAFGKDTALSPDSSVVQAEKLEDASPAVTGPVVFSGTDNSLPPASLSAVASLMATDKVPTDVVAAGNNFPLTTVDGSATETDMTVALPVKPCHPNINEHSPEEEGRSRITSASQATSVAGSAGLADEVSAPVIHSSADVEQVPQPPLPSEKSGGSAAPPGTAAMEQWSSDGWGLS